MVSASLSKHTPKQEESRPLTKAGALLLLTIGMPFPALALDEPQYVGGGDAADLVVGDGYCQSSIGCTLRAAIQEANAQPGHTTLLLTSDVLLSNGDPDDSAALGDLDITDDLTIIGDGGIRTIDGQGYDRVFHILGTPKVTLQNLIITGGLVNFSVGGGIRIDGGKVTIRDSKIQTNKVDSAGSTDGDAVATGGGIYIGELGEAELSKTEVSSNTATTAGGGIDNHGRLVIKSNSLISANIGTGLGGGIRNWGGYLSIGSSTISGNDSNSGGGIYSGTANNNFGNAIINNSTIDGNIGHQLGGGIANAGPMAITNSTISNNVSSRDGGGVYNIALGNIDLINSTVSGNSAIRNGGGILNTRTMSISSSTIYNNSAAAAGDTANYGGNQLAFYATNSGTPENDPSLVVRNSIIADHPTAPSQAGTLTACAGPPGFEVFLNSQGSNLEDANSCGFTDPTDIVNAIDVKLLDLIVDASAPGTTATHALQSNSPAVDKGQEIDCPAVDQRFMERGGTAGLCDIGAYEFNATTGVPTNYVDLKLVISDNRDPAPASNDAQLLTYIYSVSNLYETDAHNTTLEIALPPSAEYRYETTGLCSPPTVLFQMTCNIGTVAALSTKEVFVTVQPTRLGTIETAGQVYADETDAFEGNNLDTETTEIVSSNQNGGSIVNFGGSGGGSINPIFTLLPLLWLTVRRRYHGWH